MFVTCCSLVFACCLLDFTRVESTSILYRYYFDTSKGKYQRIFASFRRTFLVEEKLTSFPHTFFLVISVGKTLTSFQRIQRSIVPSWCNFDWPKSNVISMYFFDPIFMNWKLTHLWHACFDVFLKVWCSFWYLLLISFQFIQNQNCLDFSLFNVVSFWCTFSN